MTTKEYRLVYRHADSAEPVVQTFTRPLDAMLRASATLALGNVVDIHIDEREVTEWTVTEHVADPALIDNIRKSIKAAAT